MIVSSHGLLNFSKLFARQERWKGSYYDHRSTRRGLSARSSSKCYDEQSRIFHSQRPSLDFSRNDGITDIASFVFSEKKSFSSRVSLIDGVSGRELTYGELERLVFKLAEGLVDLGVEHGDVVMLLAPNSLYYPVALLAISSIGALAATPNPLGTPDDVRHQAMLTSVKLVMSTRDLLFKIEGLSLPAIVIDYNNDASSSDHGEEQPSVVLLSTILEKVSSVSSLNSGKKNRSLHDPAAVLYSSGTTGMSKAVVLSHANICSQIMQLASSCDHQGPDLGNIIEQEVHLCALPMSHIFGSVVITLQQLYRGNQTVVLRGFELSGMLAAIERYHISHIYVVPPVVLALAKTLQKNNGSLRYDLSSLQNILCGAAPLGKELIETCYKYFPNTSFSQIYGLTEVTGALTLIKDSRENENLAASVGTMLSDMEAKVVDVETSQPLPPNHKGELLVRGPTTMIGYMNDPQATSSTMNPQGWLRTGDLVFFDELGNLFVVDRIKELIKYKALQVAPAELEALLLSHPQILDAAVIPYKSTETGEIPMAFIVPSLDGNLTEDQVKAFVAEHVAPYKRVRRVAFTNAIPKTASGKILRKELVKQL
ncbi:hypothetical protein SELMODRAFT_128539 [Selaginella moellendorffii]|uniref:4-coumarate--CoA ligase n=1 Tax=Selaginella moellendorffii TaxID=88036 RepID=D8SZ79_SELML|nr:4-coumarate--CoA ligase-like 7 [Selaginella moellendorffii]EFJ10237.1 hypothetical protein SELMODRAFT_128539 [Selaginella moellendorffii]|eukprot:XP_002988726.1 4-coumarate--CoA ligase-like 7 [Selaginella moellendorffii]